jgi:hypothetical protein
MPMTGAGREPVVQAYIAWGDPLTDPAASLGQLHFDVVTQELHERTCEVTEHPVEQGVNIVDHVRPNTDRVSLEVFVSNTPVYSTDGQVLPLTMSLDKPGQVTAAGNSSFFAGGTSALLDVGLQAIGLQQGFPSSITANVLQFQGDIDYVQNCCNTLNRLRDTATLLSVVTPKQFYSNMIIDGDVMRRDAQSGTGAYFSLSFRQIRVVSSSIVDAPLPTIVRDTPVLDKGKKEAQAAPIQKESVARNLRGKATGFLSGLGL